MGKREICGKQGDSDDKFKQNRITVDIATTRSNFAKPGKPDTIYITHCLLSSKARQNESTQYNIILHDSVLLIRRFERCRKVDDYHRD